MIAATDYAKAQRELLKRIDAFFRDQEKATGKRWSDETFGVKIRSSGFMAALRNGRFVRPDVAERADTLIAGERAKWAKARKA